MRRNLTALLLCICIGSMTFMCQAQTCSGEDTLAAPSGTFGDGSGLSDYSNNLDCRWLIEPPGANFIELTVLSLSTEPGVDYLVLYDGWDDLAPVIDTLWGTVLIPMNYNSSGSSMYLKFVSDGSGTAPGWSVSYLSNVSTPPYCSGVTNVTDSAGTFDDGSGVGFAYGEYSDCQWLVKPQGLSQFVLTFPVFDMEQGADYLIVHDGPDTTAPVVAAYTGTFAPDIISSDSSMLLRFLTDGNQSFNDGFQAQYRPLPCGMDTLTAVSGSFSDGSGDTSSYLNDAYCTWLIQPPGVDSIILSFTSFNVEDGYDFVTVFDGDSLNDPVLGVFTGSTIPPCVTSSDSSLLVLFTSDNIFTAAGFSATYGQECVEPGIDTLTAPSGFVSDGSGPAAYLDGLNKKWLIQPPGADSIVLTFSAFGTEDGFDSLTVYDADTDTIPGTILGTFTGSTIPPQLVAYSGSMLLHFETDFSGSGTGWDASWCSPAAYPSVTTSQDTSVCAAGQAQLNATGGDFYSWSPSTGLSDPMIPNPVATPGVTTEYAVVVSDSVGCFTIDTVNVLYEPFAVPICIVTVDTATGKNLVVWEPSPQTQNVKEYIVYKESSQSGVYYIAGILPHNGTLNHFIDSLSVPEQKSARYKVAVVDSCGQISQQSENHKTMHLTMNIGIGSWINLIWDHYEGFDHSTYYIYRGTNPSNLVLLDSVASNLTSWTDLTPPPGTLMYLVGADHPFGCTANERAQNYNSSRSNRTTNAALTAMDELVEGNRMHIIPNPSRGRFVVSIDDLTNKQMQFSMTDLHGRTVWSGRKPMAGGKASFDMGHLDAGVYFIHATSRNTTLNKRLVIE